MQEHYKWDHSGSADVCTRKIRAEANCPQCSFNRMDLVLSDRRLPNLSPSPLPPDDSTTKAKATSTSATSASGNFDSKIRQYQALNPCLNCKTAYYFRSHQIAPLQGIVVEIGRLTNTTSSTSSTSSSSNRSATKTNNSDNNNKSHSSRNGNNKEGSRTRERDERKKREKHHSLQHLRKYLPCPSTPSIHKHLPVPQLSALP
ncbi:hypothetical protein EV2_022497 [Malus domestica]